MDSMGDSPATLQFKQQLAGMSFRDQQQALAPPMPMQMPPAEAPVQLKDDSGGSSDPLTALKEAAASDPVAAHKVVDVENEAAPNAQSKKKPWAKGSLKRLEKTPGDGPLKAMRVEITDNGTKYLCLGPAVPGDQIAKKGGLSRLVGLNSIYAHYLKSGVKTKYKDQADFIKNGAETRVFNPMKHMDDDALLKGKALETWWFPGNVGTRVDLAGLREALTIEGEPDYEAGAVRLDMSPDDLENAKIKVHKSTAFDGVMQGWGDDPWWVPSDDPHWGVTKHGTPEAVMKAMKVETFQKRKLIMEDDPAPTGDDPQVSEETGGEVDPETPDGAMGLQEGGDSPDVLPEEVAMENGIVLNSLSGEGKWRNGNLVGFTGNCSATVPMGESNSLDCVFENVDVNVKRGKVKTAKGTFTAKEAIPLLSGEMVWKVAPGATGSLEMKNNEVKQFSGDLELLGGNADKDFIAITLNATVELGKLKHFVVDGTGSFKMVDTLDIPGGWGEIGAGTSGSATIVQNVLSRIVASNIDVTLALPFGENPLKFNISGSGEYDHSLGMVEKAEGTVTLMTPLVLGGVTVDKIEGHAAVEQNELVSAGGSMNATIADAEGEYLKGKVNGDWTRDGEGINGEADLKLARNVEWALGAGLSLKIYEGSGGTGTMVNGAPGALTGNVTADIFQKGEAIAGFSVNGTVDMINGVVETLEADADLKKQIKLLGDGLTIDNATVHLEILNGRLVAAGGTAELTAKAINIDKAEIAFNWRNDGAKDLYSWSGDFDWHLFDDEDSYLGGHIGVAYSEDGTFTAKASVTYTMGEGFSASATLEIDNSLEPLIKHLGVAVTIPIMDETMVFDMSMTLLSLIIPVTILTLSLGLDVGANLLLYPLTLNSKFDIYDWKPTKDKTIPHFSAEMSAPWGMRFQAWVGAYIEAGLNIFVASAGIGAEARLVFEVPIDIEPTLKVEGDGNGVAGSFGLSLAINPALFLEIIPYLEAYVIFIDTWRYDMAEYKIELAKLGSFEWSDTFAFGESNRKPDVQPTTAKTGAPVEKEKHNKGYKGDKDNLRTDPMFPEKNEPQDVVLPGGDTISGDQLMGKKKEGASGDEYEQKSGAELTQHERLLRGIKAIDGFMDYMGDAFMTLLEGGPVFGPILLAWRVIDGELDLGRLKSLWADMMDGIKAVGEFVQDMGDNPWDFTSRLGKWMQGDITLTQLLMEDDDEVRKAVKNNVHKKANMGPKEHGGMLYILCHPLNSCTNADEQAVISICREAGKRGHLNEALTYVKGSMYDGADQVLYKLDWEEDDTIRAIFKRYKIDPERIWRNAVKDRIKKNKYPNKFILATDKLSKNSLKLEAFDKYDRDGMKAGMDFCKNN